MVADDCSRIKMLFLLFKSSFIVVFFPLPETPENIINMFFSFENLFIDILTLSKQKVKPFTDFTFQKMKLYQPRCHNKIFHNTHHLVNFVPLVDLIKIHIQSV